MHSGKELVDLMVLKKEPCLAISKVSLKAALLVYALVEKMGLNEAVLTVALKVA